MSDVDVFGPHAQMIASSQGTEQMVISGHRYFRLKATIEDDQYHINARGEGLRGILNQLLRTTSKQQKANSRFDLTA